MELLEGGDDEEAGDDEGDDLHDEMYDMAVRVVTESRQASISWLQRKLRVGYNRAARMIERMEREGVVSQAEGRGRARCWRGGSTPTSSRPGWRARRAAVTEPGCVVASEPCRHGFS
jgi:DNA segregation ATPase FtsK/SpoIIIE-like protein